ncbi:MAG: hypothetical protein JXL97_09460 [Bacteroidales bacterium]|nr:hypothetical protein [Bacteroidales bacterium]
MNLNYFLNKTLFEAGEQLFNYLGVPINSNTASAIDYRSILGNYYKPEIDIFQAIDNVYFFSIVDDSIFRDSEKKISLRESVEKDREGFLVFGIELNWNNDRLPSRTALTLLVRAFNRISQTNPVILLVKYQHYIALTTTERLNYKIKKEGEKLGKVSILKDIDVREHETHSAHLRILQELSIKKQEVLTAQLFVSFEQLYQSWQEVFSIDKLNNRFFEEIADWYFWVTEIEYEKGNALFPLSEKHPEKNSLEEKQFNQISFIRLLTRIIFVWFVKERKLIKNRTFRKEYLDERILNNTDKRDSNFYKAVLQNLFFTCLNTDIDSNQRDFSQQNRNTFGELRFRYKSLFKNSDLAVKELFADIPFLNGGLFDNLDFDLKNNKGRVYVDWFTDPDPNDPRSKGRENELKVPDYIFFGKERNVDLSNIYDSAPKRNTKVRGLINILNDYKFTIEENTPLEQEIALDPELLGNVFENLLACYNPESSTTARRATGSYYTPREVVDYMIEESIYAYLLSKEQIKKLPDSENRIRQLVPTNVKFNSLKIRV